MDGTSPDELNLIPHQVELRMLDGNVTRRPVSHFLDFVVNGESLIGLAKGGSNLVTALNRVWLPGVPTAVDLLLGRQQHPELAAGRVPLLVCAVDGDLGCGAVTAALAVNDETVTWSDFLWEDGLTEPGPAARSLRALTFDRRRYEEQFVAAEARVGELSYDRTEHEGRRFLWPWQWGWRLPRSGATPDH